MLVFVVVCIKIAVLPRLYGFFTFLFAFFGSQTLYFNCSFVNLAPRVLWLFRSWGQIWNGVAAQIGGNDIILLLSMIKKSCFSKAKKSYIEPVIPSSNTHLKHLFGCIALNSECSPSHSCDVCLVSRKLKEVK